MKESGEAITGELAGLHDALLRNAGVVAVVTLLMFPLAMVTLTKNLTAGPRLVDDNQIFMLDREITEEGLVKVAPEHIRYRLVDMGRVVPVYLVHKLFQVALLGRNLVAWGLYTALLGGLTACLLFALARMLSLTVLEAFAFALIVVLGEQSVLWWRQLHGEGIGMFLLALSLLCIPLSTRYPNRATLFRTLFVVLAILVALTKESFIVLVPAMVFALMFEDRRARNGTWFESLRRNLVPAAVLGIVCLTLVLLIATAMERTHFGYTGWKGFDAGNFLGITVEFFSGGRFWFLAIALAGAAVYARLARRDPRLRARVLDPAAALAVLVAAILVPQFLLYMSSGFEGTGSADYKRFLVPATLGLAVLTVFPIAWVRKRLESTAKGPTDRAPAFFHYTTAALLLAALVLRYDVALAEANEFYKEREDTNNFLKAVELHTNDDDEILYALGFWNQQGFTRRMTIILAEHVGLPLDKMFYVPVTGPDPADSFRYRIPVTQDPYMSRMVQGLITSADELPAADTIIIMKDRRTWMEVHFLLQTSEWFDPDQYLRFSNRRGDVAYFKVKPLPERVNVYNEMLLQLNAGAVVEEDVVRIVGAVKSPEPIDRIEVLWNGQILASPTLKNRREIHYPTVPEFVTDYVEFELEASRPEAFSAPITVNVYSGDQLLGTIPVEPRESH